METGTLRRDCGRPFEPAIISVAFETTKAAVLRGELFGGLEGSRVSRATFLSGRSYPRLYWLIRQAIGHEDKMMKWQDNGSPAANQREERFCYYESRQEFVSFPLFLYSVGSFSLAGHVGKGTRASARLSLLESTKRQAPFRLQGPTRTSVVTIRILRAKLRPLYVTERRSFSPAPSRAPGSPPFSPRFLRVYVQKVPRRYGRVTRRLS